MSDKPKKTIERLNPMMELELTSKHAGSLTLLIEGVIAEALHASEDGIHQAGRQLKEFEEKYQLPTSEFLRRYENDECEETVDFGEWIGESRMLQRLQEGADQLRGINFLLKSTST